MSDLNAMIDQVWAANEDREAKKKREALAKRQAEEKSEEQKLLAQLQAFLPDLLPTLEMKCTHVYDSQGRRTTYAIFPYMEQDWHLENTGQTWKVFWSHPGSHGQHYAHTYHVESKNLQVILLLRMGEYREGELKRAAVQAEQDRKNEIYHQEREKAKAAEEQRMQELRAQADAEDERLLALHTQAQQLAKQTMWRWPQGTTIEVYEVRYYEGGHQDEDGNTHSDYGGGWTAASALDERGRIRLEPTRPYRYSTDITSPRVVQLMMSDHRPLWPVYWTVHQYSSIEELPNVLKQDVTVSLPNVVMRRNYELQSGKSYLVEVDTLGYDEEAYSETVGEVPLPWVRALVDAQMMKELGDE